jgi:plastocyanin
MKWRESQMQWRRMQRFLSGSVVILLAIAMAACPRPEDPPGVTEPFPDVTPEVYPEREVEDVTLSDFEIDMTETLDAGRIVFHVTNEGTMEHGFAIEGAQVQRPFAGNLQPGQSDSLEVTLQPGNYVVYCPVADHRDRGMEMTMTVEEDPRMAREDRMPREAQRMPGEEYPRR